MLGGHPIENRLRQRRHHLRRFCRKNSRYHAGMLKVTFIRSGLAQRQSLYVDFLANQLGRILNHKLRLRPSLLRLSKAAGRE